MNWHAKTGKHISKKRNVQYDVGIYCAASNIKVIRKMQGMLNNIA